MLAVFFLILFCLTIVATYIIIRRGVMQTAVAGSLCATLSTVSIFAFGVAKDLQLEHSIAAALISGMVFTGLTVLMASFFRLNQPSALESYLPKDQPLHK